MGITVLDGSESPDLTLSTTLERVQASIGLSASAVTTNNITLDRALSPVVSNIVLNSTPSSGSFDWTHGLGSLRVLASDVMSGVWGSGGASTTTLTSIADLEEYRAYGTTFSTFGDWVMYKIVPTTDYNQDLFIDFRNVTTPVQLPIRIDRWRHVIIVGVEFDLIVQSTSWLQDNHPSSTRGNEKWACANKQIAGGAVYPFQPGLNLHQVNDTDNLYFGNSGAYSSSFDSARAPLKGWNIHHRIPGTTAIRWEHSGYAFVEGCNIDCNGFQGDGMIMASNGQSTTLSNANRRLYVTNSRITNYEGQSSHENYGDGVHGDSVHSQSGAENSEYYENIVVISGQEGNVHTGTQGSNSLQYHFVRNYQYRLLPAATNEINLNDYSPPGEKSSGAVISNPRHTKAQEGPRDQGGFWSVERLWVSGKSSNIMKFSDGTYNAEHSQISLGISPIDFAPVSQVGVNYNSSPSESYYNSL